MATTTQDLSSQLRNQLLNYSTLSSTVNVSIHKINQIQSELTNANFNTIRSTLESEYSSLGDQATEEIKRIDFALQTIDQLTELFPRPDHADPLSPVLPGTASGNLVKRGPYKKRPRTTEPNASGSSSIPPTTLLSPPSKSPALTSPTLGSSNKLNLIIPTSASTVLEGSSTSTSNALSKSQPSSPNALPSGMGLSALPSASGVAHYPLFDPPPPPSTIAPPAPAPVKKPTLKSRRDALANQLPLKAGRQVAFRQPRKTGADLGKEEWILARIEYSIGGDKNKYVVYDVDYDPNNPTPEQGRFQTTLKSIVPLPDVRDKKTTYPENDYSKGTQVMALYPDTTSFYSAKIVAGPLADKGKKKDKVYHVVFDEDGGKIEPVPIELVVEIPT